MDKDKIRKMVEKSRKDGDFDKDWDDSAEDTDQRIRDAEQTGTIPDEGRDGT